MNLAAAQFKSPFVPIGDSPERLSGTANLQLGHICRWNVAGRGALNEIFDKSSPVESLKLLDCIGPLGDDAATDTELFTFELCSFVLELDGRKSKEAKSNPSGFPMIATPGFGIVGRPIRILFMVLAHR
jgi:hypothetical protein